MIYYKAAAIKTLWYWNKNRHVDHWNREPRKKSMIYGQLTYDKGGKNTQWEKDSLFSKWCWENWRAKCKRMKLGRFLTPYTKISSKWIKDLKCETWNHKNPRREHRQNFSDIGHSNIFLDISPEARETKTKINYWGYVKIKSSCSETKTTNKTKRPPIEWEK